MADEGGYGQQAPGDASTEFLRISFIIRQALGLVRTMIPVKVISCTNAGALTTVGFVKVQPLVNMLDGIGQATEHGIINKVPYFRLQGGSNAVILDPVAGDLGHMIVADRDISSVKEKKGIANPGSLRKHDLSDGIYMGGILNAAPDQYVQFTSTGIVIADKNGNKMEMKSGSIDFTTVAIRVNGNVIAGFGTGDQVGLQTHQHPTAATGAPSPPTPGS